MTTIYFQLNFISFTKRRFRLTNTQKLLTVRSRQGEPESCAVFVFVAIVVCLLGFCGGRFFSHGKQIKLNCNSK